MRDDSGARHRRITEIYQEALGLDPARRATYLADACGGDDELRNEVESLISSHHDAREFLETPAMAVAAGLLVRDRAHLAEGAMLGPYKLVSLLGTGGMGEVYSAEDTRLGRRVAIKVLPDYLRGDETQARRFEQEARAVSRLIHPHICALFDIGDQDGVRFLVMELLDGETLSARLARGPLPAEQVLRSAIDIADALSHAHRNGVLHRDLKPGNVMLTRGGAKLLDFGLAKLRRAEREAQAGASTVETAEQELTRAGTIVGTLPYMAPEQLEGRESDARTDIFAFGAVLYEMATGRRAFEGASQASLIAAILSSEPPSISTLQPTSLPALDHVVGRCLAKDTDERWQSAHDVKKELEWIAEGGGQPDAPAQAPGLRGGGLWAALAAAAILAALATVLIVSRFEADRPALEPARFTLDPPAGTRFAPLHPYGAPVISPDGRQIVFAAAAAGEASLYVRRVDALQARPLAGTANAHNPFWSPDSRSIGFFSDGKLRTLDVTGGSPVTLCDVGLPSDNQGKGGAWNRDGDIVFAMPRGESLYRIRATGGRPVAVTQIEAAREESHRWPSFLPDGKHFVYHIRARRGRGTSGAYLGSLDSMDRTLLLEHDSNVVYTAPGYLLYVKGENLMAQPFDPRRRGLSGKPVRLDASVAVASTIARAAFSSSDTGTVVFTLASGPPQAQMTRFDRSGRELGRIGQPTTYTVVRLSPDGRTLAYDSLFKPGLWLQDTARGDHTLLMPGEPASIAPVWSPDGTLIFWHGGRAPSPAGKLYRKGARGGDEREVPFETQVGPLHPRDVSADGRFLLLCAFRQAETQDDLWFLPLQPAGTLRRFLQTPYSEDEGRFSPDGKWVAYSSDESGRREVYIRAFPSGENKTAISTEGGFSPFWNGDGKEIVYVSRDETLMSVALVSAGGGALKPGLPRTLFKLPGASGGDMPLVFAGDMSRDGQDFYVAISSQRPPLTVLLNWYSGLERR
jgi:Tol biopolymer transport system component